MNFCDLPYKGIKDIFLNIKNNIVFILSAIFFFGLYIDESITLRISFIIVVFLWIFIASQIDSVYAYSKKSKISVKVLSAVSAAGICLYSFLYFRYDVSDKSRATVDLVKYFRIACAVIAIYFLYICIVYVFNKLIEAVSPPEDMRHFEVIIYCFLIVGAIAFSAYAFSVSQAFWGTDYSCDIIYTSDSPILFKENVYMNLFHGQNDLRQPLFTVFSAPFMGIPFLICKLIGASSCVQAIIFNSVQMILLFMALFFIMKMMNLTVIKRICFILINYATYTVLLFSLMMEQYIVAFFWLSFALYTVTSKEKPSPIALLGAGGTLLTSVAVWSFDFSKISHKKYKEWFMNIVKMCIYYVLLMLAFCRYDILHWLRFTVKDFYVYTGYGISFSEKLFQYLSFLSGCFIAPSAGVRDASSLSEMFVDKIEGVKFTAMDSVSWQLTIPTGLNVLGIIILFIAIVSFIINRNEKSSQAAGMWCIYSVIILLIIGWGTKENGLILYALYFGWAFMVLIFQFFEKIEKMLNIRFLVPVISLCLVAALMYINIPAIKELIDFAKTYYPV